jgi:RNA polymerase sigma factor (sigma-70 family)
VTRPADPPPPPRPGTFGRGVSVPRRELPVPTAVDRVQLLDEYAGDLSPMAAWIAARCRRERDDVRQELCVILLRDGHRFDPGRVPFKVWLWRAWVKAARVRVKRVTLVPLPAGTVEGGESFDPPSREPDPAEQVERADTVAAVRTAVGELPADQRDIITRIHGLGGDERTQVEVAAALGVPPWKVRDEVRRVRADLSAALTRHV